MLANLLPGLREIRAPLAAGYLWLVVGWLLLHDRVDTGSSASGAVDALAELRDAIGVGGIAGAATFLAYLLGALWEPVSARLAESLWLLRSDILAWPARRRARQVSRYVPSDLPVLVGDLIRQETYQKEIEDGLASDMPPPTDRISIAGWRRLWLIGQRLFADVDEALPASLAAADPDQQEEFFDQLESHLVSYLAAREELGEFLGVDADAVTRAFNARQAAQDAIDRLRFRSPYDDWWIEEASDFAPLLYEDGLYFHVRGERPTLALQMDERSPSTSALLLTEAAITARLFDELPLVARRLVGEQQELFLEASRMKGEVEFRYALAIPIPVAANVLAFGLGLSTWIWIAATIAGVAAGAALLADGWRRDALRNDYLVELLAIGKAKSPTFERLLERARQTKPAFERRPIDEAEAAEVLAEEATPDTGLGGRAEDRTTPASDA